MESYHTNQDDFVPETPPPDELIGFESMPPSSFEIQSQQHDPLATLFPSIGTELHAVDEQYPSAAPILAETRREIVHNNDRKTRSPIKLNVSSAVRKHYGTRVPKGTKDKNLSSIKLFAQFIRSTILAKPAEYSRFVEVIDAQNDGDGAGGNEYVRFVVRVLLCASTKRVFDDDARHVLRHFLSEFVVNYLKQSGDECMPVTVYGYVQGVRRALAEAGISFALENDDILSAGDEALINVMNNHFSDQQSRGMVSKPHNILSHADLLRIFESEYCNPHTSVGFRNRLVFTLGLCLGDRTTSLWLIKVNQLEKQNVRGKMAWMYTGKVVSEDGAAKTGKGGIKALNAVPVVIPIYDIPLLDGKLNAFVILDEYMRARSTLRVSTDRLLLGARPGRAGPNTSLFFTNQPLGRNTFAKIVPETCTALGIRGDGPNDKVTMHGLRATMITILQEAGFSDSTIALRTGHKDVNSLKHYTNLRGRLGNQQFESIFRDPTSSKTDKPIVRTSPDTECEHVAYLSSSAPPSTNLGVSNITAPHGSITINVYNNTSKQ